MTINEFKQYKTKMRTKTYTWEGWKGTTNEKGTGIS